MLILIFFSTVSDTPCNDCQHVVQKLVLGNHKVITDPILRKIIEIRKDIDAKADRAKQLKDRTKKLIEQQVEMAATSKQLLTDTIAMNKENEKLQSSLNSYSK